MARPKKTKIEDLARIRNNQRNCRERRRGYIAELEQKVEYYEKERVQSSSTGLQTQVQKLSRDNEVLRTLLDPSSVSEDHRHQSLTNRFKSPPADWEDTSTWTQTPCLINFEYGELQGQFLDREASHTFTNIANEPLPLAKSNGTEFNQDFAPSQAFPGFAARIPDARDNAPTYPTLFSFYAPPDTAGIETLINDRFQPAYSLTPWPVLTDETAREDKSMLCSVAYRLILQFKKRQYDDREIENKIRCGFRLGRTDAEDCRGYRSSVRCSCGDSSLIHVY